MEVQAHGSHLINSYQEHRNIADLFNWVPLLEGFTAPAFRTHDIPNLPREGEWFVKGATNSGKNRWFEMCYANGRDRLVEVVRNNQLDGWIASQEIAIRPFQRYRQVAEAVTGQPVFNEWRVFILDGRVLADGFYWSSFTDEVSEKTQVGLHPGRRLALLDQVIPLVKHLARFLVIDLAETVDGDWQVVELNDGCMSGISEVDPALLWGSLLSS